MTTAEIVHDLRELANEMARVGVAMDYWGGFHPMGVHGRELIGACEMARQWAAAIEEWELTALKERA